VDIGNRKLFKQFDWLLFLLAVIAGVIGVIAVSSAVSTYLNPSRFIITQTVALIIGLLIIGVIFLFDYEHICSFAYVIFGLCLLMLILVSIPAIGTTELGGQRWLRIGGFGFQPSEFVKIGFIITFAKHLSMIEEDINRFKNIAFLMLHAMPLIILILMNDLGTGLILGVMMVVMLFFAGINWKYIVAALGGILAAIPIFWFFVLEDFQRNRILTFLNPGLDPLGDGWQVMQSQIAVGSGQIFGRGWLYGSTHLGFLPERHNDFIFSVISEEFGFVGSMAVLLLLLGIAVRCLYIAHKAKNSLGTYICIGVSAMFLFQTIQNVGMGIGLMPVTGIPLPFISYGGTSILANMMAIGLVLNVRARHKVINF